MGENRHIIAGFGKFLYSSNGVFTQFVKHSKEDRIVTSCHWNHPSSFCTKGSYEQMGYFRCVGIHDDFEFFCVLGKVIQK